MIGAVIGVVATVVVVAASVVVGRRRSGSTHELEADDAAVLPQFVDSEDDEPKAAAQLTGPLREEPPTAAEAAAQVQDHGPAAREGPNAAAQRRVPLREDPPGPEDPPSTTTPPPTAPDPRPTLNRNELRVWLGLRVDGSTSWSVPAPPGGFALRKLLEAQLRRGHRSIELPDPHGENVELALEWAKGGGVALLTGMLRLTIRSEFAEVQVRSIAVETEGLEVWFMRELPRAAWWLLGAKLPEHETPRALADDLHELGVTQRRIEMCLDVQGLGLYPGIAHLLVGGPTKRPYVPRPGVVTGVEIGKRSSRGFSMGLYDKAAELAAQRGPEHAGLIGAMVDAGYQIGDPWERIEVRLQGAALRLKAADGELLDGTHPFAALDRELLGRFWWDALTRVWMADASKNASRMRDNPMHPAWEAARRAGYEPGEELPARTHRAAIQRQLESSRAHTREQLGRSAVACAVLDGVDETEDVPEAARTALEDALDNARLGEWFLRARARYRALLDGGESRLSTAPAGSDASQTPTPQPETSRAVDPDEAPP